MAKLVYGSSTRFRQSVESDSKVRSAIFLDRDGVLIEDVNLLTHPTDIHILPGVPEALSWLRAAGFKLIVVTNQAVIARGMLDELGVQVLEKEVERQLELAGGPR